MPLSAPIAIKPAGLGWLRVRDVTFGSKWAYGAMWWHAGADISAISVVEWARLPRSGKTGPQWHASIADQSTGGPMRPSASQVLLGRCAFGMLTAEEDNHHPGHARHFWLPVDPTERVDCECKTDEVVVREPDGYEWSNRRDGECRGCELAAQMATFGFDRPCPIHTKSAGALEATR